MFGAVVEKSGGSGVWEPSYKSTLECESRTWDQERNFQRIPQPIQILMNDALSHYTELAECL
jgi:hypothetical protein